MANAETVGIWNGARREMEEEGWKLVRTLGGGSKAMREARDLYTPKTDTEAKYPYQYERRLRRSVLYPAYTDRVKSLASLPFQREPTIEGELPAPLDRIVSDADRMGSSMATFAQAVYRDAIDRGVGIFLVDTVPFEGPLTEKDDVDARPYFCRIAPDNLVGFQAEISHGRAKVTELRYREWTWRPGDDGVDRLVDRMRVWDNVNVTIWERVTHEQQIDREAKAAEDGRGGANGGYVVVETRAHGFPDGIPLVAVYTDKVDTLQGRPALMALADLNVAHWQSSSTQGDALAYCRAPTRVIKGASRDVAESKPMAGSGATVVDTSPDFDMRFVEIAGTSLMAGEREIDTLRMQMEALGMRPMVAAQGPETATGEVRADMAEKSEAQAWVEALEWALYQGFEMAAKWESVELPDDFDISLFKDSSLIAGKAVDVPIIINLASQRMISRRAALQELKVRGVLVTVEDIDEMLEELDEEAEASVQRQMDAMASRMIGERGEDEEGEGEEDDEDEDGKGAVPPGLEQGAA